MIETVYTTNGGHRFHATETCRALDSGQVLYGGWGNLRVHRIEQTTIVDAMGRGREACATCFPGLRAAWYRGNSENDYGHVPVSEDREFFGEAPDDPPVCARCSRTIRAWLPWVIDVDTAGRVITKDVWTSYEVAVLWPCTSAIVLGLVPRKQEA